MNEEITYLDIRAVKTPASDLNTVLTMERDNYNSRFVYSWSREEHLNAINHDNFLHLTIMHANEDLVLGYLILGGLTSPDKALELMRVVIDVKGKGYGRKTLRLVKKFCFESLNYHRLWLDVFEDNAPALKLYSSEGFVREGLLRECKRSPQGYRSMVIMSILEREYLTEQNK
ncbi:MAG: GNAT family N-acetyltransferase [Firmicutes bacterium]|nr:GNAT family N-acetyltransferase [Bacillota bacterium]